MNPFSILNEFDSWFIYEKCRIVNGLTDEEARTNVQFLTNGWELIEGLEYGGWRTKTWDPYVSDADMEKFIAVYGGVHINTGDFS